MRGWGVAAMVVSATLLAQTARADDEAAGAQPPALELGVGAQATLGFGDVCRREQSDVVSCATGMTAAGLALTPRWRASEAFAFGAVGQLGWGAGGADRDTLLARLAAEVRWYPAGGSRSSTVPWLAAELGFAIAIDDLQANELGGAKTYQRIAPTSGGAVGIDWMVGEQVALGLESRLLWVAFGGGDGFGRRPDYDSQLAVSVGLLATAYLD